MKPYVLCLLLGALWVAATQELAPINILIGVAIGWLILRACNVRVLRSTSANSPRFNTISLSRLPAACYHWLALLVFFINELIKANITMAYFTIMPLNRIRPGIVAVPLEPMSNAELTLLANLITLTPGTLSVDVSLDNSILYIHAMRIDDANALRLEIKLGFERRVLQAIRGGVITNLPATSQLPPTQKAQAEP